MSPPEAAITARRRLHFIPESHHDVTRPDRALIPKQEVPGMGWFAWFKDPEGNVLGLWTAMGM